VRTSGYARTWDPYCSERKENKVSRTVEIIVSKLKFGAVVSITPFLHFVAQSSLHIVFRDNSPLARGVPLLCRLLDAIAMGLEGLVMSSMILQPGKKSCLLVYIPINSFEYKSISYIPWTLPFFLAKFQVKFIS